MFVFSKGKPKTFNPICDRPNKYIGVMGRNNVGKKCKREEFGMRFNIWNYATGKNQTARHDSLAFEHPAPFPEKMAADHIYTWSNEGDLAFDPFMGSGTTALAALKLNTRVIGVDISKKYIDIAILRLEEFLNDKRTLR